MYVSQAHCVWSMNGSEYVKLDYLRLIRQNQGCMHMVYLGNRQDSSQICLSNL